LGLTERNKNESLLVLIKNALKVKNFFVCVVQLVGAQHRYLQLVASDLLTRYHQSNEDLPQTINSITHPETSLGAGSVLINCHIKVSLPHISLY